VQYCTLIGFADSSDAQDRRYHWCDPTLATDKTPFEAAPVETLVEDVTRARHPFVFLSDGDESVDEFDVVDARAFLQGIGVRSGAIIPTGLGDVQWAWAMATNSDGDVWTDAVIDHMQVLGDVVTGALQRNGHDANGSERTDGARRLPLFARTAAAPAVVFPTQHGFDEIIGESAALKGALRALEEVVQTDSSVLLLGETGTGKELFARALHARGPRRGYPLVSVNCGALPPTLIESELFGHQKGAFTGAVALRQGRFEVAHRGTLFLDEIGDLPQELQAKLLRVLQEGTYERVGSSQTHTVDVRIIAATHQDLGRAVAEGAFRADLYYRLNVFPIRLPPLRERREDIPALVWATIRKQQPALHRHITQVPTEVMTALQQYEWPGNIRELQNVVERALIHSSGDTLRLREGSLDVIEGTPEPGGTLISVERAHIEDVLRECGWRINGNGNAAERLGLHPNTLRFRMKKLGIIRREPARGAPPFRPIGGSQASGRAS